MSIRGREASLLCLAEIHEVDPSRSAEGSLSVREYLASPRKIREWVAVTLTPETGIVFLRPEFSDAASAQVVAERFVRNGLYVELPLEVVSLDSRQAIGCELEPRWGECGRADALMELIADRDQRRRYDGDI